MSKSYLFALSLILLTVLLASCRSVEGPAVSPVPEEGAEVKAAPTPAVEEKAAEEEAEAEKKEVIADYGKVKPYFIENHGQIDEVVKYYVKGPRGTVYLSGSEIVFDFRQERPPEEGEEEEEGPPEPGPERDRDRDREKVYDRLVFRLKFVEANPEPVVKGEKELGGKINYFIGSQENWRSNIPTFEEVIYEEIFDGVDMKYYFRSANPESIFIVKPGADPEKIVLLYEGIDDLELKPTGELIAITRFGGFVGQAPRIYQEIEGKEVEVEGKYKLLGDLSYTYDISAYDPAYPLMIE